MSDMFNTFGSLTTNGVLAPVYERSVFAPNNASAPYYAGRGAPPPTIAANFGGDGSSMDSSTSLGYSSEPGPANTDQAAAAASDPFNLSKSPVLWAVVFLVVGILGLRYIHWRH